MNQTAIEICITGCLCFSVFNTGMVCVAMYMAAKNHPNYGRVL